MDTGRPDVRADEPRADAGEQERDREQRDPTARAEAGQGDRGQEQEAARPVTRLWDQLRRHPSAVLLVGQLVVVLAYPFLDTSTAGRAVLGVGQMALVLTAVAAVRLTPALTRVAVLLGLPAMIFAVLEAVEPHTDWIVLVSAAVHVPFYAYVSY